MTGTRSPFHDRRLAVAIMLLAVAVGCGKAGPEMARVEGIVTWQDKPLADASVMFMPKQSGQPATGTTNSEGRFHLTTFQADDGAVVGDYDVVITKIASESLNSGSPDNASFLDPQPIVHKWLIPERYGKTETSGLSARIVPGGNALEFRLMP